MPRPDFTDRRDRLVDGWVDQAHRESLRPRSIPTQRVGPAPVRARFATHKIDEVLALVIAFIAASFVFAHLLVAAGVGLTNCQ